MLGNLLDNACKWGRSTVRRLGRAGRRRRARAGRRRRSRRAAGAAPRRAATRRARRRGGAGVGTRTGHRGRPRRTVRRRHRRRSVAPGRRPRPPRPARSPRCCVIFSTAGARWLPRRCSVPWSSPRWPIGIGVNTAVFSWIEVFALSPLPGVPRASEFHLIEPRTEAGAYPGASWLEFQDLRADLGGTADLLAFRTAPLNVGEAARTERVFSLLVSDGYFQALGVRPELGRVARARRGDHARGVAGGRRLPSLLADAAGGRSRGRRPGPSRQRRRSRRCRRAARRLPGHGARPAVRPVGAGDDGAGDSRRIARARGSALPRLRDDGPPAARRTGRGGGGRPRGVDAHPGRDAIRRPIAASGSRCCPTGGRPAGPSGCSCRRSACCRG